MSDLVLAAAGPSMLAHRVSCGLAITDAVYVADVAGVHRYQAGHTYGDTPAGAPRYRWSLGLASRLLELSSPGDTVFLLGFKPRPWATAIAVLGRDVVEVSAGRSERHALGVLETHHRQRRMFA